MTATYDFSGRTVLVTGAGQGIGFETARFFASCGAAVAVVDRDTSVLQESWGAVDGPVRTFAADVRDVDRTREVVEETVEWGGQLDVLVNNAGITRDAVAWKMTDEAWREVLEVHLFGSFSYIRTAIGPMREAGYGRIVNMTSTAGLHGNFGQSNYAAAKAGVVGLTKTVAKEVARFGITVNALAPSMETAMVRAMPADQLARLRESIPIGRLSTAREVAGATAFLASEEAGSITGTVLAVDGGLAI